MKCFNSELASVLAIMACGEMGDRKCSRNIDEMMMILIMTTIISFFGNNDSSSRDEL